MPRETIVLNSWHSGIADDPSRRDIGVFELEIAQDIFVDSHGIIKSAGSYSSDTSLVIDDINSIASTPVSYGYGIFTFAADHTSTGGIAATNYFVQAGNFTTDPGGPGGSTFRGIAVTVQESDGTKWVSTGGSSHIELSRSSVVDALVEASPNFYYVAGGLRICDGEHDNTETTRRGLFFIDQQFFGWTAFPTLVVTLATTFLGWYDKLAAINAPDFCLLSTRMAGECTAGGGSTQLKVTGAWLENEYIRDMMVGAYVYNFTHDVYAQITGTSGDSILETVTISTEVWADGNPYYLLASTTHLTPVMLTVETTAHVDATFNTGIYEAAVSMIYDGEQESALTIAATSGDEENAGFTIQAGESLRLTGWYFPWVYSPRITGSRIYIKQMGNVDWSLAADVDFRDTKGLRTNLSQPFGSGWTEQKYLTNPINYARVGHYGTPLNTLSTYDSLCLLHGLNVETHEAITGIPTNTTTLEIKYKTVAINNNIVYAGNVKRGKVIYEDSIFKSIPGKYDSFPIDRRLDVVVSDGAAIVKLETFADRLIQFKQNAVYIINIAQEVEFLEHEIKYAGIDYPYQSIATEYGIAWVNENGCYLYDGRTVIDLLMDAENPRRRKLKLASWRSHVGSTPLIGYDARDNKLMVFSGVAGELDAMIFDFRTMAWTKQKDAIGTTDSLFSNIIVDWDGYPIWRDAYAAEVYRYKTTDLASSSNISVAMKDLDFGDPGIKKNVYAVYISYTGQGLEPYYRINGTTEIGLFTVTGSTSATGLLPSQTSQVTVKCVPATSTNAKNIYSFQVCFRIGTTWTWGSTDTHEINDVTVIGRKKGNR